MTGEFDLEDLDLLADYAAGLLDEAQRAEVARLVTTDPAWARAFAALNAAEPAVQADLATLGATPTPMPADIAARINAAVNLASRPAAGPVPARHRPAPGPASFGLRSAGAKRPVRRGKTARTGPGGPRERRRAPDLQRPARAKASARPTAWVAAVAVAAGVVVFAALGIPALRDRGISDLTSTRPNAARDEAAGAPQAPATVPPSALLGVDGPRITASGRDYQRESLSSEKRSIDAAPRAAPGGADAPGVTASTVPAELSRLTDAVALRDCLAAVAAVYPGPASSVDYARFESAPALVIGLVAAPAPGSAGPGSPAPTAVSRVVVVGPACGAPGSGADVRYATG